jgi:hypothetical protein
MRGLFRAFYFFCERMQKKRQLGIRAFFIFERCERNTVLVAGIRNCLSPRWFAEATPD